MLDLSAMRALEIDAERRTAWAETGVTAGEYTAAAGAHGLATGFGDAGTVGIGGITLAGGVGFLARKHGLTIDRLLAADVVTATASSARGRRPPPRPLLALRGGGGNFGVATRLQFRLHEVGTIVGGMLFLPAGPEVIAAFIAEAEAAPEQLSTIANVMPAPPLPFLAPEHHGRLVVMAMLVYAGDSRPGSAPSRRSARSPPRSPTCYARCPTRRCIRRDKNYRPIAVVRRASPKRRLRAAETIVERIEASTALMAVAQLRVLGGAMARVPADATAFAHRDRRIMANVAAIYKRPEERPEHEAGRRPRG